MRRKIILAYWSASLLLFLNGYEINQKTVRILSFVCNGRATAPAYIAFREISTTSRGILVNFNCNLAPLLSISPFFFSLQGLKQLVEEVATS